MHPLRSVACRIFGFIVFSAPLVLTLLSASSQALAQEECAYTCSARCTAIVDHFAQIVDAHRARCDDNNTPVTCVPNCAVRYSDGSCREFGRDYCGRNAVCVARCSDRYSDGTCRTYDSDFCGEGRASCVRQCVERYSDGNCRDYGADVCGRNPSCQPLCVARYSDGTCREYGSDLCSAGAL